MSIYIEPYNERSFVVRGPTKPYKQALKILKGRWNPSLKGGEGWLFSNCYETKVREYLQTLQTQSLIENIPELNKLQNAIVDLEKLDKAIVELEKEVNKIKLQRPNCLCRILPFCGPLITIAFCVFYRYGT